MCLVVFLFATVPPPENSQLIPVKPYMLPLLTTAVVSCRCGLSTLPIVIPSGMTCSLHRTVVVHSLPSPISSPSSTPGAGPSLIPTLSEWSCYVFILLLLQGFTVLHTTPSPFGGL
jgi:hypothetical protein